MSKLTQSKAWQDLAKHYESIKHTHMRELFADDENRFEKYSLQINDLLYDYSKNRIDDETLQLLMQLARDVDLPEWIEKMYNGEAINHTENRAVLHTALRDRDGLPIQVDGVNVLPEILEERKRVKQLAEKDQDTSMARCDKSGDY